MLNISMVSLLTIQKGPVWEDRIVRSKSQNTDVRKAIILNHNLSRVVYPAMTESKFGSSYKAIQVGLLDRTTIARSIYKPSKAVDLLDNLLQMFNVVEKDYFGLYYLSDRQRKWLDLRKKIWPQIMHLDPPYQVHFGMQYYPQEPSHLQEEVTIYLMFLQLRKDVIEDRLITHDKDRAEMCSLILQAEGAVSSSDSYLVKHRSFFVHLQRSSAEFEARILEMLYNLSSMDGLTAEARMIQKSLPLAQYDVEPYPVRSDAQPSMKNLSLAIAPLGVMIYQDRSIHEIFKWAEIWNSGYDAKTFWVRIYRDGENSRQKYTLSTSGLCKVVWKTFRLYFKFYIHEHKIPPKVAWGRVAPTVNRADFLQDVVETNQVRSYVNRGSNQQHTEQNMLVPTTEL